MTVTESASYFEAYRNAEGLVIEVYLTETDFELARRRRLVLAASGLDHRALGISKIYLTHTVPPLRRNRGTTQPTTQPAA